MTWKHYGFRSVAGCNCTLSMARRAVVIVVGVFDVVNDYSSNTGDSTVRCAFGHQSTSEETFIYDQLSMINDQLLKNAIDLRGRVMTCGHFYVWYGLDLWI